MHIEKAMQVHALNRNNFTQEKIKLLQLVAGNGSLGGGAPYKVGVRFFLLERIEDLGFVLKGNLSPKQLLFPMLPKDYFNDEDEDVTQDSKPAATKVARVSLDSKSTKAKKVTKKSNNPITSYFGKKDSNNSDDDDRDDKNELSCGY